MGRGLTRDRSDLLERWAAVPALLVSLFALSAGLAAGYAPPAEGQVAVVFPPWVSEGQAIGAVISAGGRFVGPTRLGSIVIAYAGDPGFGTRIRDAGAWATLAAQGLCSPTGTAAADRL